MNNKTIYHQISGLLIIGGLPGFIWGWFHVADETNISSFNAYINVYTMPVFGLAVTLVAYFILSFLINNKFEKKLISFFAASGVACYYWYRIPALFGFGNFGNDGLLINLRNSLPGWGMLLITMITTAFFFYWLVIRKQNNRSWVIRPEYAIQ